MRFQKIIVLFPFLFASIVANSQVTGGSNTKLESLYNEGKYENCLLKADGLSYKEDYSKDPEPYLYISMCFYQLSMSEDPDIKEDYKDAFKDAVKNAAKFVKKDKKDELYSQNIEFINLLKEGQVKRIKNDFDKKIYSKAAVSSKMYDRLNRNEDATVLYLAGVNEVLSNNLSQGTNDIETAKDKLNQLIKDGTFKVDAKIKSLVIDAFLAYSQFLISEEKMADAKECINLAMKLFPNDGYIKVQHNLIEPNKSQSQKAAEDSVK